MVALHNAHSNRFVSMRDKGMGATPEKDAWTSMGLGLTVEGLGSFEIRHLGFGILGAGVGRGHGEER